MTRQREREAMSERIIDRQVESVRFDERRFVHPSSASEVRVTAVLWASSFWGNAAQVAKVFSSFPPTARVAGDDETVEVMWTESPTDEDIAVWEREREAAAAAEVERLAFEQWKAEREATR